MMAKKRTLKPGISPLHFFGSEVRLAREAAGMTQGELGKIANCDTSLVSRIEGGEANPSLGFPEACDMAFPHMNGFYTRFWTEHQDWPGGMFPQWADPWMTSEAEATMVGIYQPIIFPGLFQTAPYARAIFKGAKPHLSDEAVDQEVDKRLNRQRIFARENPPHVSVILDELVLHRMIGSRETMHEQLTHVVEMSCRSYITVQIVPAEIGAHAGLTGAFMIAKCPGKPDILYVDAVVGQTFKNRPLVTDFAMAFEDIRAEALPASRSRDLTLREAEERWQI